MQQPAENPLSLRYLELLKKTLAFSMWPEPPIPAILQNRNRVRWKAAAVTVAHRIFAKFGLVPCHEFRFSEEQIAEGKVWRAYADTMIGMRRLDNLQACVERILKDGVPGDLIETGAWRGGACIFMRGVLAAYGVTDRKVFVADSFEGLPAPDEGKYPADRGDKHHLETFLCADIELVKTNFQKYHLFDDQVVFVKGWFNETLPKAPIKEIAVLRLDGDMYGSTMDALQALYPRLSPGGYCIVDDYVLPGCRAAVDDYRRAHSITHQVKKIDSSSVYWRQKA